MFQIKHFLDPVEKNDGRRVWIEPFGLVNDLRQWCSVNELLPHLAPPRELWEWFEQHPDGYEFFRGRYHEWLSSSPHRQAMLQLVKRSRRETITFLHQGDDPAHNTATALHEFLGELEAYCPPEA